MVDTVTFNTPPTTPVAPAPEAPQRPESVPEKFWDAEKGTVKVDDLAKSYAELEKKFSTKPAAPETKPAVTAPADANKTDVAADPVANDPTGKFVPFTTELNEKGALSDESYTKLAEMGYSKDVVDTYIEGSRNRGSAQAAELVGTVGGADNYKSMITWAQANLQPNEIAEYNEALKSPGAKFAIQGLHSRFTDAQGKDPALLTHENGGNNAGEVYRSVAEMTRDMQDKRYKTDKAFRKDVEGKVARSNLFGNRKAAR
jgi:hypothetical protein